MLVRESRTSSAVLVIAAVATAVVLSAPVTTAVVPARAYARGLRRRRRRWQPQKYFHHTGRQLDDRTFHLVLTGGDLVGGLQQGGQTAR
jgi:hypothetical protein